MTAHSCMTIIYHFESNLTCIRDAVATDIIHQHSARLDYYKGYDEYTPTMCTEPTLTIC